MDRYARQRLLAPIGDRGQARIAAATFAVQEAARLDCEVERQYLARAGATHFVASEGESPAFAHASTFRHPGARDFAAGAWRALAQLRSILELSQ
jgi:hypothetical protein